MGDQELFSAFIEGNVLLRVTKEDGSQFDVPAVMSGLKEENSLYSLDFTTCGEPKWILEKMRARDPLTRQRLTPVRDFRLTPVA